MHSDASPVSAFSARAHSFAFWSRRRVHHDALTLISLRSSYRVAMPSHGNQAAGARWGHQREQPREHARCGDDVYKMWILQQDGWAEAVMKVKGASQFICRSFSLIHRVQR